MEMAHVCPVGQEPWEQPGPGAALCSKGRGPLPGHSCPKVRAAPTHCPDVLWVWPIPGSQTAASGGHQLYFQQAWEVLSPHPHQGGHSLPETGEQAGQRRTHPHQGQWASSLQSGGLLESWVIQGQVWGA